MALLDQARPDAEGRIEMAASTDRVYALVSDPELLAECANEYASHRWLDGATQAAVGARFRGENRRGARRWSTVVTITDAVPGERFGFDVALWGFLPVAHWEYAIESAGAGCRVTERTWDRRAGWFRIFTSIATGVRDRAAENRANIATTLTRLKARAES